MFKGKFISLNNIIPLIYDTIDMNNILYGNILSYFIFFSSVRFSCSVMSNPLRPRGLQHATRPYPSPTLGPYSNSCPLSQWCHPNISSSVVPFSSHLQSFQASGSLQMSQFFTSGDQSISFLLCLLSLLFTAICKPFSDYHFAFLHLFFLGMVLITASYTMWRTSVHSSSGTLSDLIPSIYLSLPLHNNKGFDLGHTWMVRWFSLDGWMASLTRGTWVWVGSGSWW